MRNSGDTSHQLSSEVQLIINTPSETSGARKDGYMMRRLAVELEIPFFTTVKGSSAAIMAMEHASRTEITVDHLGSFGRGPDTPSAS